MSPLFLCQCQGGGSNRCYRLVSPVAVLIMMILKLCLLCSGEDGRWEGSQHSVSRRGPALQTPETVSAMRAPASSQVGTCQSSTQTFITQSQLRRHSGTKDVIRCLGLSKWPTTGPESEVSIWYVAIIVIIVIICIQTPLGLVCQNSNY